jgi:hypothetical protein
MSQVIDQESRQAPASTDLTAAVQRVLETSAEPLTISKIRAALPTSFRKMPLEELADTLRRQATANVLYQYPKYRSAQDRFWDRAMPVHVAGLLRAALEEGPLAWPQLRRRLPDYAIVHAEVVLQEQVAQGKLHRHPPAGSRSGERYGAAPPDAREYLRRELPSLFRRLQEMGFSEQQLREAAMLVLQEEEWGEPEPPEPPRRRRQPSPRAEETQSAQQPQPEAAATSSSPSDAPAEPQTTPPAGNAP